MLRKTVLGKMSPPVPRYSPRNAPAIKISSLGRRIAENAGQVYPGTALGEIETGIAHAARGSEEVRPFPRLGTARRKLAAVGGGVWEPVLGQRTVHE